MIYLEWFLKYYELTGTFIMFLILFLKHYNNEINNIIIESENFFRESKEMPRIGEGWISETNFIIKLKRHFQMKKS